MFPQSWSKTNNIWVATEHLSAQNRTWAEHCRIQMVVQTVSWGKAILAYHKKSSKCCWPGGERLANAWDTKSSWRIHFTTHERPAASSQKCHLNPITVHFSIGTITSLMFTMSLSNPTWQAAYVKKPILAASKYHKCARNLKLEGIS